jgi:MazG family protein
VSDAGREILRLLEVMRRLRDPQDGCPWDREQTYATIAPYTIEEAYEVADAIERGDARRICDELGDLLFQVVFHSRIAEERGDFAFADVAAASHDKLVRRHPHVFADARFASAEEQSASWEQHKARERAARAAGEEERGVLADIPRALPALTRAAKLGKRAASVGFDWGGAEGVREKVHEELGEVGDALAAGEPHERVAEEIGDLLFTVVNWSRHLGVDPERALREANGKFERRFRRMEALAEARGADVHVLDAAGWEELWQAAKAAERKPGSA